MADAPPSPDARAELHRARALPVAHYVDPTWVAREAAQVFARSWQLVGSADRLTAPGDHVVDEIAGRPLLVVRHSDGELRAFYNVCKHRAGPLAVCDGRGARALRCKYHGWTYELDGALRSAPEMGEALDFDRGTIRLSALAVREWQGLVFVAMDAATPAFEEVYGGIRERIAPVDLSALRFVRRDGYELACNWKVYVDNYLEGYHLPHVHPGLSRVLDYRAYDTELCRWYSLQHSPLRDQGGIYGEGDAWYFFIYPNVMCNVMPGRLQTNRVLPLGIDRCRVEFDYYYGADPEVQARAEADREFSEQVQQEDIRICELVQKGLASGVYEAGRLCPRRESGVWHFHELLRQALAEGAESAATDHGAG
ncbi:MAG TPA: SRPBCC family protein [Planctomycetota bacterium]|nr:SRPBCC family protein [Planctomycetota bacterium]